MGRMSVDDCLTVLAGGRPAHPVLEVGPAPPRETSPAIDRLLLGVQAAALAGRAAEVRDLVRRGLDYGLPPEAVLRDALIRHSRRSARASSAATSSCRRCSWLLARYRAPSAS